MKFYLSWEIDWSRIPEDSEERAKIASKTLKRFRERLDEGIMTDWGGFGNLSGYAIFEGSIEEVRKSLESCIPILKVIDIRPIITMDAAEKMFEE